jgi:hypothetical protein
MSQERKRAERLGRGIGRDWRRAETGPLTEHYVTETVRALGVTDPALIAVAVAAAMVDGETPRTVRPIWALPAGHVPAGIDRDTGEPITVTVPVGEDDRGHGVYGTVTPWTEHGRTMVSPTGTSGATVERSLSEHRALLGHHETVTTRSRKGRTGHGGRFGR